MSSNPAPAQPTGHVLDEDAELLPRRRPEPRRVTAGVGQVVAALLGLVIGLGTSTLLADRDASVPALVDTAPESSTDSP